MRHSVQSKARRIPTQYNALDVSTSMRYAVQMEQA